MNIALRTVAFYVAWACVCLAPQAFCLDPFVPQDVDASLLPGTYNRVIGTVRHTITFNKDGTFSGKSWTAKNALEDEYEGNWSVQGGYGQTPTLRYVFRKSRKIANGTEDADYIVVLNKKSLSIVPIDGKTTVARIWWRVQEKEPARAEGAARGGK